MKDNLHELVFILDQSASVEKWIDEAPKALKKLFKNQRKEQFETKATVTVFGSEYRSVCDNKDIEKINPNSKIFKTSGVCPFIDSMHKTIDDVGARLANTPENERPSKIIVTLVVFGRDNASKKHTYEQLHDLICQQHEIYKWEFFLVTDFTIVMEKLGIPEDNTVIFRKDSGTPFADAYNELNTLIDKCRSEASATA